MEYLIGAVIGGLLVYWSIPERKPGPVVVCHPAEETELLKRKLAESDAEWKKAVERAVSAEKGLDDLVGKLKDQADADLALGAIRAIGKLLRNEPVTRHDDAVMRQLAMAQSNMASRGYTFPYGNIGSSLFGGTR